MIFNRPQSSLSTCFHLSNIANCVVNEIETSGDVTKFFPYTRIYKHVKYTKVNLTLSTNTDVENN